METDKPFILSSYSTRVLMRLSGTELSRPTSSDDEIEDKEDHVAQEVDPMRIIECELETQSFSRIVLDKGQIMKNPNTPAHR